MTISTGAKFIDIPRPEPLSNAVVCRLIEVDFEVATLTLRALGPRMPPFASGNYVVMRQEEWREMRDAAQGIETAQPPRREAGLAREGESPVAESDAPETRVTVSNGVRDEP